MQLRSCTLFYEVLANALDQHLLGRCTTTHVELAADGTITVTDDGPGIAVANGTAALDRLLTTISVAPTVDGHRPHVISRPMASAFAW